MTRSPFPGMDPFLEDPIDWPDFHVTLITAIRRQLLAVVAPHYRVQAEERPIRAGEPKERYLLVRDSRSRQIVTGVEILSPSAKQSDDPSVFKTVLRRKEITERGVNWIELDLLRASQRQLPVGDRSAYCIVLRRTGEPGIDVWFANLRDPLPTIAVPLLKPDPDVPLALQAAFDECYEESHYADFVNYDGPIPDPPLSPADAAWVRDRIDQWRIQRHLEGTQDPSAAQ